MNFKELWQMEQNSITEHCIIQCKGIDLEWQGKVKVKYSDLEWQGKGHMTGHRRPVRRWIRIRIWKSCTRWNRIPVQETVIQWKRMTLNDKVKVKVRSYPTWIMNEVVNDNIKKVFVPKMSYMWNTTENVREGKQPIEEGYGFELDIGI